MKMYKEFILLLVLVLVSMQSCQKADGNSTGSEFMPDMGHSIAYEANYYNYYWFNTWSTEEEYYKFAQPRVPVEGTVPRKSSEMFNIPTAVNEVNYAYPDTEEGRTAAMNEITENPLPITEKGLKTGKELYNIYCGICHGEGADGAGYLVRDDGGMYPVQPANLLLEEFINASNGRYYHSIMHGRNLMGSYKDKLNYNERWEVIHYIRSLQAKELEKEYSETSNTLNTTSIPLAQYKEKSSDMVLGEGFTQEDIVEEKETGEHEGAEGQ